MVRTKKGNGGKGAPPFHPAGLGKKGGELLGTKKKKKTLFQQKGKRNDKALVAPNHRTKQEEEDR